MKQGVKCQRIFILSLLSLTVFAPLLYLPGKIAKHSSSTEFDGSVENISGPRYARDSLRFNAIQQEIRGDLRVPELVVYKDGDFSSVASRTSNDDKFMNEHADSIADIQVKNVATVDDGGERGIQHIPVSIPKGVAENLKEKKQEQQDKQGDPNGMSHTRNAADKKLREMKDQVILAKVYLAFAPPNSNSHLVKELQLRIKEVEQAVGDATKDSDLHRGALQKLKSMDATLSKASSVYSNCSPMSSKLRAMTANTEELLRAQRKKVDYLVRLLGRTIPKGLHCLSMRLTDEYFSLPPEEREFPNREKLQKPDLYHYAVFSDNVLACAVVVNSTVSSSLEPEKVVFHVVTDALNAPAIKMWFLTTQPGEATIEVQTIDGVKVESTNHGPIFQQPKSQDPRFCSSLNYLRFYLPELFPKLNKIVLLDHDVVVQRDLGGLWEVDMKGNVNGAVETCGNQEFDLFPWMDVFINFSDPIAAKNFKAKACTWAFGMNMFNLQEWRRQDLTSVYHKWSELGKKRQLWKAGSLPLGLVTFYNHTLVLDRRWHLQGLGVAESGIGRSEIERAAVIHYNGQLKPWLDIGLQKYKGYWNKYVSYGHPFLERCNIHQ
ncbi:probable galacturonosyltransferase 6 [Aristolochia californica]|uniref:probable galacturonosyltransferase 6 n=1 Tax=Aristolochia californica TaxID=171875 RepID=UPI0035DF7CE5